MLRVGNSNFIFHCHLVQPPMPCVHPILIMMNNYTFNFLDVSSRMNSAFPQAFIANSVFAFSLSACPTITLLLDKACQVSKRETVQELPTRSKQVLIEEDGQRGEEDENTSQDAYEYRRDSKLAQSQIKRLD